MSRFISSATALVLLAAPAFAEGMTCNSPSQDQWISKEDLTSMYSGKGYDVKNIKIESGCYEIYALDTKGARVEIIVDPMTGEQAGSETEG